MNKQSIPERKRLAAIFASFTILIVGTISLIENMTIDYYSVLGTLQKVIPSSIIMGGLGWVMGMILDKPAPQKAKKYNNNLYLKALANQHKTENNSDDAQKETTKDDDSNNPKINMEPNIEPEMGTK